MVDRGDLQRRQRELRQAQAASIDELPFRDHPHRALLSRWQVSCFRRRRQDRVHIYPRSESAHSCYIWLVDVYLEETNLTETRRRFERDTSRRELAHLPKAYWARQRRARFGMVVRRHHSCVSGIGLQSGGMVRLYIREAENAPEPFQPRQGHYIRSSQQVFRDSQR